MAPHKVYNARSPVMAANDDQTSPNAVVTVPNLITACRMVLVIIAAALFARGRNEFAAVLACGTAVALDWFDGRAARWLSQCSRLGSFIDPLADKMAMALIYGVIALNLDSAIVWSLVALMIARDAVVTLRRTIGLSRPLTAISSDRLAKIKTTLQGAAGVAVLVYAYVAGRGFQWMLGPVVAVLIVTTTLSYVTAWRYLRGRERTKSRA